MIGQKKNMLFLIASHPKSSICLMCVLTLPHLFMNDKRGEMKGVSKWKVADVVCFLSARVITQHWTSMCLRVIQLKASLQLSAEFKLYIHAAGQR